MGAEALTVTVAVIGDPGRPAPEVIPEYELRRPYRERPKVELDVRPEETLGEVLSRAAVQLRIDHYPRAFVSFYDDRDEDGYSRNYQPILTLADDTGRATWSHYFADVPYERLITASEAGALDGDPLRPYLILQPGIGNGLLPDWNTIKAVWDALSYVADHIAAFAEAGAAIYGVKKGIIDRLRKRSRATQAVIDVRGADWSGRGGDPYAMQQFLDDRLWRPDQLARLLDCSAEEAETLLWAFGFKATSEGDWRLNVDEESKVVSDTMRLAIGGHVHQANPEQLQRVIGREVGNFISTGEAKPVDWTEWDWID